MAPDALDLVNRMMLSVLPLSTMLMAAAHRHSFSFEVHWSAHAITALVAGILILIRPKLLNFIIAAYLLIIGVTGLFNLSW